SATKHADAALARAIAQLTRRNLGQRIRTRAAAQLRLERHDYSGTASRRTVGDAVRNLQRRLFSDARRSIAAWAIFLGRRRACGTFRLGGESGIRSPIFS